MAEDQVIENETTETEVNEVEETVEVVAEANETVELDDPPEKTPEEIAQAKIDERFAEITTKQKIAEKKAQELQAEIDRRDAERAEAKKKAEDALTVPDFPKLSEFPDEEEIKEYHEKVMERDKIIREKADIEAERKHAETLKAEEEKREAEKADQKFNEDVKTYFSKAKASGMDRDTAISHGRAVNTFLAVGFTDAYILPHERGPEIVKYLSENKDTESKKFEGMNVMQASAYIESKIVPNLPKQKTKKPTPETPIDGNSPPRPNPKGKGKGYFY